jgi:hypothetical protein
MKTLLNSFFFILAVSLLVSCSSLNVNTDYDRTADFSKYKTFSFYKLNVSGLAVNELNQTRIVNAIKAEMVKKGFSEVNENPDLMVNATTVVQVEKQYNANSYGMGGVYRPYRWGGGYGGMSSTTVTVQNVTEGSLVVDVLDSATNSLVWTATGSKELASQSSTPDQDITDAVNQIMQSFPPVAKK